MCFAFIAICKKILILRMGGRRLDFIFIGLGEILSLLPTYPFKGSKFHVVLFQNIFVSFDSILVLTKKKFLKKEIRGRVGLRLGNK